MHDSPKIKVTWTKCSTPVRELQPNPVPASPLHLWLASAPSEAKSAPLPQPDPSRPALTSRVRVPAR